MQQTLACDTVLAHDNDLAMINEIAHGTVSRLLNGS